MFGPLWRLTLTDEQAAGIGVGSEAEWGLHVRATKVNTSHSAANDRLEDDLADGYPPLKAQRVRGRFGFGKKHLCSDSI